VDGEWGRLRRPDRRGMNTQDRDKGDAQHKASPPSPYRCEGASLCKVLWDKYHAKQQGEYSYDDKDSSRDILTLIYRKPIQHPGHISSIIQRLQQKYASAPELRCQARPHFARSCLQSG